MLTPRQRRSGFTIVELLIVIVVIAILATISVVAYSGIQDRAIEATVKSDLANFAKKIEIARVDSVDGGYPINLTSGMGIQVSKDVYMTAGRWNWYYCVPPGRASYALGVKDIKNRGFFQTSTAGIEENGTGTLGSTETCAKVGTIPSEADANTGGYQWDAVTGTGAWQSWTN